ncbi:MAG: adenosylmethionine decarboxylase [Thermoflexus sp.]|jgi:S-adenosylmethionine decarboxylase proenzyme|nr:adenosylmethionine decarboxylase [Thermoflexus sp.]
MAGEILTLGRLELARLLRAIVREGDPWQAAGAAGLPFPRVVEGVQQLLRHGFLAFDGQRLHLTDRGQALARELGVQAAPEIRCAACGGTGVDLGFFAEVTRRYAQLARGRPEPLAAYDQGYQTLDSVIRRVALMVAQGDVEGKDIIVLGDDDLASLALALTGLPRSVVVIEIDRRLCNFIEQAARQAGLNITVYCRSLTERLPTELLGRFDTFLTDPTETEHGLLLFIEKGFMCLRKGEGCAGYFGITRIESNIGKWHVWQRELLSRHAIAFTHILPDFSLYANWEDPEEQPIPDLPPFACPARRPWYRSTFFRVETLPEFQPPEDYVIEGGQELYEDEDAIDQVWRSPDVDIAITASVMTRAPTPFPTQLTLGRHIIAEFWRCRNREPLRGLKQVLEHAVRRAGATLLNMKIHRFVPDGFSALVLLAESHISLHAWPEYAYVAVDVFTCGEADPEVIVEVLKDYLQPEESAQITLERGLGPLMVLPAPRTETETSPLRSSALPMGV